jgi:hypothetical protein
MEFFCKLFGEPFGGFTKEAAAAQYLLLGGEGEAAVAGSSADDEQSTIAAATIDANAMVRCLCRPLIWTRQEGRNLVSLALSPEGDEWRDCDSHCSSAAGFCRFICCQRWS